MPNRIVYKSTIVAALDEYFSGDPDELREQYAYVLDLIWQNDLLADIIARLDRDGRGREEFVDAPPDSPLAGPEFEQVMRRGYTEAIHLALRHDPPVPIESLWMSGASSVFEVHLVDGARQVTALLMVPQEREWGSERSESTSWVVDGAGDLDQTSGPRGAQSPSEQSAS